MNVWKNIRVESNHLNNPVTTTIRNRIINELFMNRRLKMPTFTYENVMQNYSLINGGLRVLIPYSLTKNDIDRVAMQNESING